MAKIENGWFQELIDVYHGQALSLEVQEVLCQHRSKYQDIMIFKSKSFGNVLVLDGVIQLTEKDEFGYQEMLTFLPLNSHPNPKKVLVIGAGDGGVIREILKHPLVKSIVQCELDEDVIKFSKKYLPNLACGYGNAKHKLHIGCGKEFLKNCNEKFDVIINDLSDNDGPAAELYGKEYYELIKSALEPNGIVCSQGENLWLEAKFVKSVIEFCKSLFPVVDYGYANLPTYPCGHNAYLLCSRSSETQFSNPVIKFSEEQLTSLNIKFYNSAVHEAAFAIPQYFKKSDKVYDGSCYLKNQNWFWNKVKHCSGESFGLVMEEILYQGDIKGQHLLVFKNYIYGNVLVIDGQIQYTENDRHFVQESLAYLSLNSHENPEKVLIIGGLNNGIVQLASYHKSVQKIAQLETNEEALEVTKTFFPQILDDFGHRKFQYVHIGNYVEYLKLHPNEYDVIITVPETFSNPDTSKLIQTSLKQNGISISKVPSFWLELDYIKKLMEQERMLYPTVKLAYICVPTSPCGQVTFILRSLNPNTSFESPIHKLPNTECMFYNLEVHRASFALPQFIKNTVKR